MNDANRKVKHVSAPVDHTRSFVSHFALFTFHLSIPFLLIVCADLQQTHAQTAMQTGLSAFLTKHCIDCHSGEDAEAGLNFETFSVQLGDAEARRRWVYLYDRVADGEMPPNSAEQPDDESKTSFLKAVGTALTHADLAQREVVLRRLNRNEYSNTVRDLFAIYVDVSRVLLDDSTENGFDNTGARLTVSGEQLELYLEAADLVLDQVFGPSKPPKPFSKTGNFTTLPRGAGTSERKLSDGVVLFSGAKHLPLYDMSVPEPGLYKIRIQIRTEQSESPVAMHVSGGNTGQIAGHSVGFFEAPVGRTKTVEFTDRAWESGDNLAIGMTDGYPFWNVNPDDYRGPGLFIGDITIEGPIDEWSASRQRLLAGIDPSAGTLADIRSVLLRTLPRAFRRPIDDTEVAPYVALAKQALDDGRGFEHALRLGLKGVLCAPEFLYLEEPLEKNHVTDHALAARLSYFLWSSLPDEQLSSIALQGKLRDPDVLKTQVDRMLADSKSQRFIDNFTGQWLRLRDIDFTVPDRNLYPEYNALLRQSMLDETHAFFREILDNDLSVKNFIDSDFLMLNQPLAEFYGIGGVKGLAIRRVERETGSVRGGVLTQASVLKVSADGTRTSPVLRGVWILNHFFGTPPPPPPPTVSTIQPDVRGASTIREELAKHRADQSCNRCHRNIDPPGFALESFDVLGAERDWYRTRGQGGKYISKKKHPFSNANVQYQRGPEVDSSGITPDGRKFADVREYKRLLMEDDTAMARSLTRLLLSYSLGRELGFSDRPEVERIVAEVEERDYGLRSILYEIVQSETFRSR